MPKKTPEPAIQPGDVVKLRSGARHMTVLYTKSETIGTGAPEVPVAYTLLKNDGETTTFAVNRIPVCALEKCE